MGQRNMMDYIQKAARISTISNTHEKKLRTAVEKWFAAEFVKPMKLPLLKKIYQSGCYDDFIALIEQQNDVVRIAILEKLDKHNPKAQMLSKRDAFKHLRSLADGSIKPAPKPKKTVNRTRAAQSKKSEGLIASSKY